MFKIIKPFIVLELQEILIKMPRNGVKNPIIDNGRMNFTQFLFVFTL